MNFFIDRVLEQQQERQGFNSKKQRSDNKFQDEMLVYDYLDKNEWDSCRELSVKDKQQQKWLKAKRRQFRRKRMSVEDQQFRSISHGGSQLSLKNRF